jgi:hypothetical protein
MKPGVVPEVPAWQVSPDAAVQRFCWASGAASSTFVLLTLPPKAESLHPVRSQDVDVVVGRAGGVVVDGDRGRVVELAARRAGGTEARDECESVGVEDAEAVVAGVEDVEETCFVVHRDASRVGALPRTAARGADVAVGEGAWGEGKEGEGRQGQSERSDDFDT